HERLETTIVADLCEITDALPQIDLPCLLYPSPVMNLTIATLYVHIISFLVRALEWYEESKLKRAIHPITKPAALRYNDFIKEIQRCTRTVYDLAAASSHVEQRDIHHQIRYPVSAVQCLEGAVREI
ncbi:hypothetical protein GQ43DRAFT_357258, partial [Delitschia confertaspora ATCC 74209]